MTEILTLTLSFCNSHFPLHSPCNTTGNFSDLPSLLRSSPFWVEPLAEGLDEARMSQAFLYEGWLLSSSSYCPNSIWNLFILPTSYSFPRKVLSPVWCYTMESVHMLLHLPHQELLSYIDQRDFWSLLLSTESMANKKLYSDKNGTLTQETGQTCNRKNEK